MNAFTIDFDVVNGADTVTVPISRAIIAGYTGRDRGSVQAHIDELARIGIAPPPAVPMFYDIPRELVTADSIIAVDGPSTSGEVEPVLVNLAAGLFLGVGSDHTDREVEKKDIGESKASAPKPVSRTLVPFESVAAHWDEIEISCMLDGTAYQRGCLGELTHPDDLFREFRARGNDLRPGDVMFCGTPPLLGGEFRYGTKYQVRMTLPGGLCIEHEYTVEVGTR